MAIEIEVIIPGEHVLHKPYREHPERPERIEIIMRGLSSTGISPKIVEPMERPREILYQVHEPEYVRLIEKLSASGRHVDSDTYLTKHSFRVALKAASGSIDAAEKILGGSRIGISFPRPPGHHAGRAGRALGAPTQGFCLFNNAALAAIRLVEARLSPVAIIDIDIHHGNGTQEIFWKDPRVIHIDLHDSAIYPGTGWHVDIGSGEGAGTKINIPLIPGSRDPEYIYSWIEVVEPVLWFFKPGVLVISAGFDAHEGENMGYVRLSTELYRWIGYRMWDLFRRIPSVAGIVFILEGGYGSGLYRGLPEFLLGLLGRGAPSIDGERARARREHIDIINSIKRVINSYYRIF
ncbi:MAG: histone deacetylase family protein [Desulfurococcales archaeon]|jgi:acetoin utilization deacetylase AcuC-like enzyme|nr:histone deacetylase family protein [Desulfurococcales archaeon]